MKIVLRLLCPRCLKVGQASNMLWGITGKKICQKCADEIRGLYRICQKARGEEEG